MTLLVTVIVHCVVNVCVTAIDTMFAVKVKSSPAVVLIVEQSIVPGDVVILKMFVLVVPVVAAAVKVAAGALASTVIEAVTVNGALARSLVASAPYSTV